MCPCFFFQAEDGIRDRNVTGVQTCALPICRGAGSADGWRAPRQAVHRHQLLRHPGYIDRERSEERRVGKECRSRGSAYDENKKKNSPMTTVLWRQWIVTTWHRCGDLC